MPAIVIPAPISSNHAAPVTAGGTGATTAAAARTNLDVYSKSEVTNAISQSTAIKPNVYNYTGPICSSSATSSGDIFSYFSNLQRDTIYIVILSRLHYTWNDSVSVYIAQHDSPASIYGKLTIKEGSDEHCPKLDANGHVVLPSASQYSITITLIQLISY